MHKNRQLFAFRLRLQVQIVLGRVSAYVSGGYAPKKCCWPETRDAFFPDDDTIANVKPTAETTTATIPLFKFAEEEEDEEEEEEVLASSAESNKGALS